MIATRHRNVNRVTLAFTLVLAATGALAHEYYLLPQDFTPPAGTEAKVEHRLGQAFKGGTMPYIDRWIVRAEAWRDGDGTRITGTNGDLPAFTIATGEPGALAAIYESNIDYLDFTDPAKFDAYLDKEGLTAIRAEHAARGLPEPSKATPIKEAYARFAKTLMQVGDDGTAIDTATGLTAELVAQANPLSLAAGDPLPVRFLWKGEPLAGITVKVFPRQGEEFTHKLVTDAQGRVSVPDLGPGPYLLNAIRMGVPESAEARERGAHWQSWWASLTFSRAG